VVKPEWGLKRTCQSCGVRFYDLNHEQIVCPKCEAVYDAEAVLKSRRGRPVAVEKVEPKPRPEKPKPPVQEEELEEVAAEEDEEDESVLEDASELGEDEDIGGVKRTEVDKEP
jgi:uncharacterized protein (TIGR02300 family)